MNIAVWILEGDNKMKTLINKANPAIRMTAPEIEVHEEEDMYFIPVSDYCIPMCIEDWTLVEEEPEVDFKVKERKWVHDAVDSVFPEDGEFMSEFDFRKIIKDTARHFYELGLNARKEK